MTIIHFKNPVLSVTVPKTCITLDEVKILTEVFKFKVDPLGNEYIFIAPDDSIQSTEMIKTIKARFKTT